MEEKEQYESHRDFITEENLLIAHRLKRLPLRKRVIGNYKQFTCFSVESFSLNIENLKPTCEFRKERSLTPALSVESVLISMEILKVHMRIHTGGEETIHVPRSVVKVLIGMET